MKSSYLYSAMMPGTYSNGVEENVVGEGNKIGAGALLWAKYFMGTQKHIPVIKFHKDKYGDELLIDVVTLDMIRASKNFANALRQSFYGVMLTTGGEVAHFEGKRLRVQIAILAVVKFQTFIPAQVLRSLSRREPIMLSELRN